MRHNRISNKNNSNLSKFKKKFDNILRDINKFNRADKTEAVNYIHKYLQPINSTSCKTELKCKSVTAKCKPKTCNQNKIVSEKLIILKPWLTCPVCNESKSTKISLLKHLESHIGIPMSCLQCRGSFNSQISFDWHKSYLCAKKQTLLRNKYKCEECSKEFLLPRHLRLHEVTHKKNNCSYCDTVLTGRDHLIQHLLHKHNVKLKRTDFQCDYCDKFFIRRRSLFRHLQQHLKSKFICAECGNISNTVVENENHGKVHEKQKPWQCFHCKDRFARRQLYFNHLRRHDRYKCLSCNESYASKFHVYKHKRKGHVVQGLEPRLHCPYCPSAFHRTLLLQTHMRRHKDIGTTTNCKFCNQTFNTPHQYYKHCLTTTHDKIGVIDDVFICENCGNQYTKKYLLEQHLLKAHNKKNGPFSCKHCDYTSQFRTNISRHIRLHFTNEKQFVCDHCGKLFSNVAVLTDHINYIHKEVKQFKCVECEKSFKRKTELTRHQSAHSDLRPYSCDLCSNTYKRVSHLRRHEKNMHGIVNKSNRVQRFKTDNNGAVIAVPLEAKKRCVTEGNETSNTTEFFQIIVPPENISLSTLDLVVSELNQQNDLSDKLQLHELDSIIYTTDSSNCYEGNNLHDIEQYESTLLPFNNLETEANEISGLDLNSISITLKSNGGQSDHIVL